MNQVQKRLFSLLRSALWQKENDSLELFDSIKDPEWEAIYRLSTSQGVHLLAYDGLRFLPSDISLPFSIQLKWAANVMTSKNRFEHYLQTIEELAKILREEGVDLLLFKGYTLSAYYPVPHYREGGDIDVFLFDKSDVLDRIANKREWEIDRMHPPHSRIIFNHELIENHHSFFEESFSTKTLPLALWEAELWKIIQCNKCAEVVVGEEKVLKMPLLAEVLYFSMHNAKHLASPDLAIRQLCDYVQLMRANADFLDVDYYHSELKRLKLNRYSDLIASLCYEYLDFKDPRFMTSNLDRDIEKQFSKYIFIEKRSIPKDGFHLRIMIDHIAQIVGKRHLYAYINERNPYAGLIFPSIKRMIKNRLDHFFYRKANTKE